MANATDIVKKGSVRWTDEFIERSFKTLAAETRLYPMAMIGVGEAGYLAKFDDTSPLLLFGVVTDNNGGGGWLLPAGTQGDGTLNLRCQQPKRIELAISGVAVTDIGKTVYALYDQTGTLDYSATTYANVAGHVVDVVASGIALVELAYDGIAANARLGAAKRLAATGAQTISKFDAGKIMFCGNTAALTLTLPPVADVPAGRWVKFVKDHASDTNAITLDGDGSENINGSTTVATMDAAYDTMTLVSNGTRWVIDDDVA